MVGWLVYHPRRQRSTFRSATVYHDTTRGNQDPYLWNASFLHTYCHITQMSPVIDDIIFWVSGDAYPHFSTLLCDLVFVVKEKRYWTEANRIAPNDRLVDSLEAYIDHYRWHVDHHYARRRRYTLKADPVRSFQPQDAECELFNVVQVLRGLGLSLPELQTGMRAGFQSKLMRIPDVAALQLYACLDHSAAKTLHGEALEVIRKRHPELAS